MQIHIKKLKRQTHWYQYKEMQTDKQADNLRNKRNKKNDIFPQIEIR